MELRMGAQGREWLVVDDPVLTRLLGRYDSFKEKNEPDFTPSDLVSLALLAKSENSRLKFHKYYYERAFAAVVLGLGVAKSETLVSQVRKFVLNSKDLAPDWQALFTLRQKLHLLADVPAQALGAQPDQGAASTLSEPVRAVVDWYVEEVNKAVQGVLRVDQAICGLLGWDAEKRVAFETLVKTCNFPDRAQIKTFFRPTGLQNTYKAYEGLPDGRT